jgi:hypothetical protein
VANILFGGYSVLVPDVIADIDSAPANGLVKRLSIWLCPFAGGISAASFLTLKNLPYPPCGYSVCSAWFAFGVYLARDTVLGYLISLPLLALARHIGVKSTGIYMLIAVIAALPMAYVLANPLTYAWTPTEEDFKHGPYWLVPGIYALVSSSTGLLFGLGSKKRKILAQ